MKKLLFVLFFAASFGCTKENELSESIYISDSENPELPAYTEWGYNTFGANYDRSIFKYSDSSIPLKVTKHGDELAFIFQGVDGSYDDLTFRFTLSNSNVNVYQDLIVFNDTIIDLSTKDVKVEIISNGDSEIIDIFEGELNFKRSQVVYLDDTEHEIILSGYFNFKFIVNDIPSNMSDGRFDFGVNNENFYILE